MKSSDYLSTEQGSFDQGPKHKDASAVHFEIAPSGFLSYTKLISTPHPTLCDHPKSLAALGDSSWDLKLVLVLSEVTNHSSEKWGILTFSPCRHNLLVQQPPTVTRCFRRATNGKFLFTFLELSIVSRPSSILRK